jgi:hypothetical protein
MIVVIGRDLLFLSRIEGIVQRAGGQIRRIDDPGKLPASTSVDLVLVDWTEREASWRPRLLKWLLASTPAPRILLFGSHTDLAAHADARASGLGPMWARSRLLSALPELIGDRLN